MRVLPAVLALALLLLLAGCVGPFGDDPATATEAPGAFTETAGTATETEITDPVTSSPTPAGTDVPETTATPTDSSTDTASGGDLSDDNPFGQKVVPVRVNDTVDDGRNTTALATRAIDYWNLRIDRYTPYKYRFELAEDPDDARVEVRYVDEIENCGRDHDERTVGCAPLLEEGRSAPDVAVAEIEVHGSNSAVTGTIQHEFGHLLSLEHDDEPLLVMGYRSEEPVTNAMDRAVPWFSSDLSVYVDHASLDGDRDRIDEQTGHAIAYYNDGAEGTIPDNVTFTRTDHEASADVVITNDESYPCGGVADGSSRVLQTYSDIDQDPEPEVYGRSIICVDVDEDAVGWHVGHWLGRSMGLEEQELAEPLRDAGPDERRSNWWE